MMSIVCLREDAQPEEEEDAPSVGKSEKALICDVREDAEPEEEDEAPSGSGKRAKRY